VIPAKGGKVEKRAVQTGLSNWEVTEITSGLKEGEYVVSSIDREGLADGVTAEIE
jgi:HlyD family secretion protein